MKKKYLLKSTALLVAVLLLIGVVGCANNNNSNQNTNNNNQNVDNSKENKNEDKNDSDDNNNKENEANENGKNNENVSNNKEESNDKENDQGTETQYDPFGKYEPTITIDAVRFLDGTVRFQPGEKYRDSLEKNVWALAYEEDLGIKFNYLWTPPIDQYDAKWNVAVASGDIPDMGLVSFPVLKMLVDGGLAADMGDVVTNYASEKYNKALEDDGGVAINYNTFNGELRGLPITGAQPDDMNMIFLRNDWLEKVNMDAPQTMEDVKAIAKAFVDNQLGGEGTIGLAGCKEISHGTASLQGFLNGYNAYLNIWIPDGKGSLVYSTIQPEMKEALLALQEMYEEGLMDKEFSIKDFAKASETIAAGKCGMTYGIFWAPLFKMNENIISDEKADWQPYQLPSITGNPAPAQASAQPSLYFFVNKDYEHPEAAVKIANYELSYIGSDPLEKKYEIDTTDGWEYFKYQVMSINLPWQNANSQIALTEAYLNDDTSNLSADLKISYDEKLKPGLDEGVREFMPEVLVFGPNSTYSIINEYRFSGDYVTDAYKGVPTDTMSKKGKSMNDKLSEAMLKVIMGAPIETFDNAVEEWKQIGGDEVTKEVQEWYENNK